jgi:hypothetical protein
MRRWIDLIREAVDSPRRAVPFDGIVYHNSNARFDVFNVNPERGVYFANEPDHEYGRYTYRCRVKLQNAAYYESLDNMEIDREALIEEGFDGRIVDYAEESDEPMFDYIAFFPQQIEILEVIDNTKNK